MTTRAARATLTAVASLAVAGLAAGCGVAHPGITNGAVSGCFKSLPVARSAVHDPTAHLIGVHRVAADQVPHRLKNPPPLPGGLGTPSELDTTVCAVAFKGPFAAAQVTGALPGATGEYAVVLVDAKKLDVVASYVGDHLPRTLRGRTV